MIKTKAFFAGLAEAIRRSQYGWKFVGQISAQNFYYLKEGGLEDFPPGKPLVVETNWATQLGEHAGCPVWVRLIDGDVEAIAVTHPCGISPSDLFQGLVYFDYCWVEQEMAGSADRWYLGSLKDYPTRFPGLRGIDPHYGSSLEKLPFPAMRWDWSDMGGGEVIVAENSFSRGDSSTRLVMFQDQGRILGFSLVFNDGFDMVDSAICGMGTGKRPPLSSQLVNVDAGWDEEEHTQPLPAAFDEEDYGFVYAEEVPVVSLAEYLQALRIAELVAERDPEFGSCCGCGKQDGTVRNLYMLHYKSPEPGIGCWGCFQCGLEVAGATAVMCDECHEADEQPLTYIRGEAKANRRAPISELTEPFDHDMSRHPEAAAHG